MKTPWVIGIVAGAHVLAVAGIMVIQGCGTTQGTVPAGGEVVMPPSAVVPEPTPVIPEPPPAVKEWPPATTTEYVVKAGDSLSKIAARFGLSTRELAALNGIDNLNMVRVGQKLKLPGKVDAGAPAPAAAAAKPAAKPAARPVAAAKPVADGKYVVKPGDCLSKIAAAHGCTTKALMQANNLTAEKIIVGQKLVIPTGTAVAKPTPSAAPAPAPAPTPVAKPVAPVAAPAVKEPLSLDSAPVELPDPDMDADMVGSDMREHIVGEDEDLPRIAMRYGVTVTRLKEINNLVDGTVRPGQKIQIPIGD